MNSITKTLLHFLFQAISLAVQRGNVISVLGTSLDTKKLDEIFNM